jgi:hypothetical protein
MIKAKQICVASDVGRKLTEDMYDQTRLLVQKLRVAGLHANADALEQAAMAVYRVGADLERAARDAFCAARRGEELPQ